MPEETKNKIFAKQMQQRKAMRYAREKYPEEFKKIKELRKTDKEAFKAKQKELLDKASKEMPEDWKPQKRKDKKGKKCKTAKCAEY
jgi:hypothetical protein